MRRKHQQTYHKREIIPDKYQKVKRKPYCNQVAKKENNTSKESEAVENSIKAVFINKIVDHITVLEGIAVILILIIFMILVTMAYRKGPADKKKNVILRHYSEVLRKLDDEPEDITASPYKSNIPKVIQKDIDKMMTMGEDASIVYYNDEKDQIVIEPSENGENGYKIQFNDGNDLYSTISIEELESNISFYRNEDTLVIYGGPRSIRDIDRYTMNNEEIDRDFLENSLVDLYGADIEVDDARYFDRDCTLIRKGSEFSIYRLGEKLYSTNFEGGEIKNWSYYYVQTTDGDCYNLYYSMDPDDYWVKLYKVAENVDEILNDEKITILDAKGYIMEFQMLRIGNKKYAQLPDPATERAYGQNCGRNHRNQDDSKVNFTSRLMEVSALSSSRVEIVSKDEDYRGNSYVWYLRYYFQSGDREGYIEKRINGLDSKVSKLIPQSKLDMFNEKVISVDEVEEYINQLRTLYDEYTDNTF